MTAPTLPDIIVEVAMNPGKPVSGAGTLILNDPTFGLLDTDWLADADAWTDVTPWVYNFSITRGSTRLQAPLLQFDAGTLSVTLDNSDGRFDPDNLAGPYVSGGVSQVRSMLPVRIRAIFNNVEYQLFKGFVDSWQEPNVTFVGQESIWTLQATDAFKVLAGIYLTLLNSAAGSGEDTGARINRILDAANWYTGVGVGARQIDTGNSTLQGTTYDGYALDLMSVASDSELGQIYVDGSGAVVFRNRHSLYQDARSATSQATFGDNPGVVSSGGLALLDEAGAALLDEAGLPLLDETVGMVSSTELPCAIVGRADDDTTIGNDIQATRVGGTLQEVTDAASIAMYLFPRIYNRSDLILQTDIDVLNWASWVLYVSKTGEDRFESISVDPQFQPQDLWPQALGREIGDRITGVRRPPGVPSPIVRDGFISGVTHTFDATASTWLTEWTLQDASKYGSFLTLNNPVTGTLNHNALTF